ncbi:MAG TPA: hypothetical protein VHC90_06140 [Bryobacteraceae bacterium]|nr:hypothetical protein [Bryobacteraceae bacterium]
MNFRFLSSASLAFLLCSAIHGQSAAPLASPVPDAAVAPAAPQPDSTTAGSKVPQIKPDLSDPMVVHAQQSVDRIRGLVQQGILPPNDFLKAQDDLNDALDQSILRFGAYNQNILPEQADQMVVVAQRMFLRRQRRASQIKALATTGVLSRSEAETAIGDVSTAKMQLDLAIERASLVREMAIQKAQIEAENDAESHPEWNGKLYVRYDGNGTFTRPQFDAIAAAYETEFGKAIPVSADGQTATHRAMGFDHTGRIDIALNPDTREGEWLLRYLQRSHIPYYAFRTAIAGKATGAHIHLGPGSTRLTASTKSCCGS